MSSRETDRDDGGPAFAGFVYDGKVYMDADGGVLPVPSKSFSGMSLRDWYAGMSLMGRLADGQWIRENIARYSWEDADAMLKARKGGE